MDLSFFLHNDSSLMLGLMVGAVFALFPDWLVEQDLAFQKRCFGLDLSGQHETIVTFIRFIGFAFILACLLGMM